MTISMIPKNCMKPENQYSVVVFERVVHDMKVNLRTFLNLRFGSERKRFIRSVIREYISAIRLMESIRCSDPVEEQAIRRAGFRLHIEPQELYISWGG